MSLLLAVLSASCCFFTANTVTNMTSHTFVPEVTQMATVRPCWDISTVTDETGVYGASPGFVRKHCGPIANTILDSVPQTWFDACEQAGMLANIDVRVHRLNHGEYPAVPGWHCDGALRETFFAQPDIERVRIRDTILTVVSTHPQGVSNPQWADDTVTVSVLEKETTHDTGEEFVFWREVHRRLPEHLPVQTLEDGQMVSMSCNTLHRVMPAHNRGARLLFRMSMWHNPYLGNQGRKAVTAQRYKIIDTETVWVTDESSGW